MSLLASLQPLYSLSGFLVGLLVGQTGMGGGSLMTPLLVLVFGMAPVSAVGTDLIFAAATKSVGTLVHGVNRSVDWRIVGRLAAGSLPATALTVLAMARIGLGGAGHGALVTKMLGIALILTALSLPTRHLMLGLRPRTANPLTAGRVACLTVLTGVVLGVLVTISSVGAGALGVMVLLLLYPRVKMSTIVGSDIAHAVPLTLLAGMGHWWLGSVNGGLLFSLLLGSIPGVVIGSRLSLRLPDSVMRAVLAVTLAVVGAVLVV